MLHNISGFSVTNPKKSRNMQTLTGTFSVPAISFSSATTSSVTTTISNYDASFTYAVSSSAGTAARSGASVTVSGLTANQSTTVTVTATGSLGLEFSTTSSSFPSLPTTPTLSRSGGTTTTVTVTIGNYDAGLTYTIGSTVGSASRTGDTISVTGLTEGQAVTVTATASNTSGSSTQGSLATGAVPATPTISFSSATDTTATFTISNYNAAYSYSVSSSGGSASRSGSTITLTGLAESTSYTAYATATNNGVSSAQGSGSGSTIAGGAIEQIATVTVASISSSILFTSIPQTYSHLILVGNIASSSTAASFYVQLNAITAANTYKDLSFIGGTSSTFSSNVNVSNNISLQTMPGSGSGSTGFFMEIYDYASTSKKKNVVAKTGFITGSNNYSTSLCQGMMFNDNNGITTIQLGSGTTFGAPTKVALYGVKG